MNKLIAFYTRHRALTLSAVCVLVVACVFVFPDTAHAAADDPEFNKLLNSINQIFNQITGFLAALFWPVILMIGSLLDNELIFGGAMGERLLSVWVQIRNLVNIVFVLILLAIAVYNVLGLGEDGGLPLAFKTVLPKFVLALIAVNFSFLASRVVLDFTNVLTGAVFALPTTTTDQPVDISKEAANVICGTQSDQVSLKPLWCDGVNLNEKAQNFFARLDRTNITMAYAIRFTKAPQLKFIRNGVADLTQLGFNIIFNAALFFAYAISFIVLFLVLLFRVVALWVGVVLSPLIAISIVLPNLKELAGEGAGKIQEQFVRNAIAPIAIGLVLSVGYIMLDGLQADKTIHGPLLASNPIEAIDPNAIPTDINDLQQLMIAVAVIAIVWVGVFAGTSGTAASFVTDSIKEYAGGFAKWVGKLPTYAQLIPVGEKFGNTASIQELVTTVRDSQQRIHNRWGGSLLQQQGGNTQNIAGAQNPQALAKAIAQFPYELRNSWKDLLAQLRKLHGVEGGNFADASENHNVSRAAVGRLLEKFPDVLREVKEKYKGQASDTNGFAELLYKDIDRPPPKPEEKKDEERKIKFKDEQVLDGADAARKLGEEASKETKVEDIKANSAYADLDDDAIRAAQKYIKENPEVATNLHIITQWDEQKKKVVNGPDSLTPARIQNLSDLLKSLAKLENDKVDRQKALEEVKKAIQQAKTAGAGHLNDVEVGKVIAGVKDAALRDQLK